jgi:nitrate/TMAO reductase-like tetraheme cytochrome c subunit
LGRILSKIMAVAKRHGLAFVVGLAFAIAAFLSINAISAPLSTSKFCGTACHEMDIAYKGWAESPHNLNIQGLRSECVDCHLPPKEQYFRHLFEKARTGGKDVWLHYLGPQYDKAKVEARVKANMKNETCLYCHKDLLASPSSKAVYYMHKGSLQEPNDVWGKCLACHKIHAKKTGSVLAEPE